jgi:hypothetical protein
MFEEHNREKKMQGEKNAGRNRQHLKYKWPLKKTSIVLPSWLPVQ